MQVFKIEYVETTRGYFGVEAETEEEALERFENWRINDDYVYDIMNSSCDINCDSYINENAFVYEDDVLTDEKYQQLELF